MDSYPRQRRGAPPTGQEIVDQARGKGPASEATSIEQTRAIAQVQGAIILARQAPRDELLAAAKMREACRLMRLAERAFFGYPRGGQTITGPSIHLAKELARCWGNIDYGVVELARDEQRRVSEMMAYAWDLEANIRTTTSFLVPHRRDTTQGAKALTELRDIYENNANNAARRLRECIFRLLPQEFTEEAQELCQATLEQGDSGKPLSERREELLKAFHDIGIGRERIEKRVGKKADRLSDYDIGQLRIQFRSIRTGEADAAELFPEDRGLEAKVALAETAARSAAGARQATTGGEGSHQTPADATSPASANVGTRSVDPRIVTLFLPNHRPPAIQIRIDAAMDKLEEVIGPLTGEEGVRTIDAIWAANEWINGAQLIPEWMADMRSRCIDEATGGGHG